MSLLLLLLLVLCWYNMPHTGFAIVKLATDRKTSTQYAVKIMTLPPVGVEPGDNESTRCGEGACRPAARRRLLQDWGRQRSWWFQGLHAEMKCGMNRHQQGTAACRSRPNKCGAGARHTTDGC